VLTDGDIEVLLMGFQREIHRLISGKIQNCAAVFFIQQAPMGSFLLASERAKTNDISQPHIQCACFYLSRELSRVESDCFLQYKTETC